MFKGKLAALCLLTASLLLIQGIAFAGIVDPCASSCVIVATGTGTPNGAGDWPLFVCPQGDTDTFDDQLGGLASGNGYVISVTVIDDLGFPIPNISGADFWMVDCDPLNNASLCGGAASSGADSLTNASGTTTMGGLGGLSGGGCADGMSVIVQGFALLDPAVACSQDKCLPINLRSPDLNGSLIVDLVDLSLFAAAFPPQAFGTCADFDINGIVNLQDLSRFAFHFGPPGHTCF